MGEVLLIVFCVSLALVLCYIFFGGKKKKARKEKKEPAPEKKVEKAIKTDRDEKNEEKQEVVEVKEEVKKEKTPFKIIRKQSNVKINKKALKSGSRNPSITKVFDKNLKQEEKNEETISTQEEIKEISVQTKKEIERFGTRDNDINTVSTDHEFSIIAPKGSPNRAPIIGDRTNFASHLSVAEDGNLSGVSGTGIKDVLDNIEKQTKKVDDKTDNMLKNIKKNFMDIVDDVDPFDFFNERPRQPEVKKEENSFKKIDAKTLIIADAISNPKYKNKK